jgi:FAD/FMN-containing dehydrogenase
MISGDVCVRWKSSHRGSVCAWYRQARNVLIYCFGHAGDGNLHTESIAAKKIRTVCARDASDDAVIELALQLGGTVAGEHASARPNGNSWLRSMAIVWISCALSGAD